MFKVSRGETSALACTYHPSRRGSSEIFARFLISALKFPSRGTVINSCTVVALRCSQRFSSALRIFQRGAFKTEEKRWGTWAQRHPHGSKTMSPTGPCRLISVLIEVAWEVKSGCLWQLFYFFYFFFLFLIDAAHREEISEKTPKSLYCCIYPPRPWELRLSTHLHYAEKVLNIFFPSKKMKIAYRRYHNVEFIIPIDSK